MDNEKDTLIDEQIRLEVKKDTLRMKIKGESEIMINTNTRRQEVRNMFQNQEAREFYKALQLSLRENKIVGGVLVMPEVVEDRIKELISKYSGLYDEVQVVPVGTDGRVIISVGEAKAVWHQVTTTLDELEATFELMELDDVKLGGYIPVANCVLADSVIDTVMYLEELLAKALAYGLDDGIINGVGDYATKFEPVGILMNLPETNKVTIPFTITDILSKISLIDIGTKDDIGEVIAIMKRKSYYKYILPITDTTLGYPNIGGVRVKFSPAVAADDIILGDYKEYILAERKKVRLESSDQARFLEEQTLFKVVGRYDGKPHNESAFVKLTKQA